MRRRTFFLAGLAAVLLIAGVLSFHASSRPDGLEYVAEQTGFSDTSDDHAASDGPLADYGVGGIDDARLSGGLAGVIGVGVTALLMGGLVLLVRRKTPTRD
jgi:hypothetical protein